jgi:hypothetical protein
VYAGLVASGDSRNLEAARMLRERSLPLLSRLPPAPCPNLPLRYYAMSMPQQRRPVSRDSSAGQALVTSC